MFRVPTDARNPSFDSTRRIGFIEWLLSSKKQRQEWQRLRNEAAKKAATNFVQEFGDSLNSRLADVARAQARLARERGDEGTARFWDDQVREIESRAPKP